MPNLVEIGPVVVEKKIFKFFQCIYTIYFVTFSPWKTGSLGELKQPEERPLYMHIIKTGANSILSSSVRLTLYVLVLRLTFAHAQKLSIYQREREGRERWRERDGERP